MFSDWFSVGMATITILVRLCFGQFNDHHNHLSGSKIGHNLKKVGGQQCYVHYDNERGKQVSFVGNQVLYKGIRSRYCIYEGIRVYGQESGFVKSELCCALISLVMIRFCWSGCKYGARMAQSCFSRCVYVHFMVELGCI